MHPNRAYCVVNVAVSLAIMTSNNGSIVTPNPSTSPWTPQIKIFGKLAKHFKNSLQTKQKLPKNVVEEKGFFNVRTYLFLPDFDS